MEIDDFLDKEIQSNKEDVANELAKVEKKPVPSKVSFVGKGPIKDYFQLWSKISDVKYKWDDDLYDELDKASGKVKEEISKSLLLIEKEKNAINVLITKAFGELRHNNFEAAAKLYSEISDKRNEIPNYLLEDKKELNKSIFSLYENLHNKIDSKFIIDFKESIEKINNFIRDSFWHLDYDIDKSKNFYENALDMYKNLPNGFLPQKLELGNQLLTLYKDLSVQTQIEILQKKLSKKPSGYKYVSSDDQLKRLSEVIKKNHIEKSEIIITKDKKPNTLLSGLVGRKLDRAKINIKKGLFLEAKKNVDAILKVDPDNEEANEILNSIPAEY